MTTTITTEKINNARIAVIEYNARRTQAVDDLTTLIDLWHTITYSCTTEIVCVIGHINDDWLQLESGSSGLRRTHTRYEIQCSREYNYRTLPILRLLSLIGRMEEAIEQLPARLADNCVDYSI
jgi:hypothetical protein